jgi:hypothetical protein
MSGFEISNASPLILEILKEENFRDSIQTALIEIGKRINLVCRNEKEFKFNLLFRKKSQQSTPKIILKVVKGSLLTHVWNKYARFDDEYSCDYMNSTAQIFNLWEMKELDVVYECIKSSSFNWIKMREIMINMEIENIGLAAFANLFGHVLLCLPLYLSEKHYLIPMPAMYM